MSTVSEIAGWITIKEAAEDILKVSRQRVHQLIKSHGLETFELTPRMKMVRRVAVEKIAESERPSGVHVDRRKPAKKRPGKKTSR